jgi:hypothetical protein
LHNEHFLLWPKRRQTPYEDHRLGKSSFDQQPLARIDQLQRRIGQQCQVEAGDRTLIVGPRRLVAPFAGGPRERT